MMNVRGYIVAPILCSLALSVFADTTELSSAEAQFSCPLKCSQLINSCNAPGPKADFNSSYNYWSNYCNANCIDAAKNQLSRYNVIGGQNVKTMVNSTQFFYLFKNMLRVRYQVCGSLSAN